MKLYFQFSVFTNLTTVPNMNNPYEYCLRLGKNFDIEYVSIDLINLLNSNESDLIGKHFFNCFQLDNACSTCELHKQFLAGKPQIIQFSTQKSQGKQLFFKSLCKPVLNENNELLCIQKFVQNISDLVQAENAPIEEFPRFMH